MLRDILRVSYQGISLLGLLICFAVAGAYAEQLPLAVRVTGNASIDDDGYFTTRPHPEAGAMNGAISIDADQVRLNAFSDWWATGEFIPDYDSPTKHTYYPDPSKPHKYSWEGEGKPRQYYPGLFYQYYSTYVRIVPGKLQFGMYDGSKPQKWIGSPQVPAPYKAGQTVRWLAAHLFAPSGDLPAGMHLWVKVADGEIAHGHCDNVSVYPYQKSIIFLGCCSHGNWYSEKRPTESQGGKGRVIIEQATITEEKVAEVLNADFHDYTPNEQTLLVFPTKPASGYRFTIPAFRWDFDPEQGAVLWMNDSQYGSWMKKVGGIKSATDGPFTVTYDAARYVAEEPYLRYSKFEFHIRPNEQFAVGVVARNKAGKEQELVYCSSLDSAPEGSFALGEDLVDGAWHGFNRDLAADLAARGGGEFASVVSLKLTVAGGSEAAYGARFADWILSE